VKAAEDHWVVQEKKGRKIFSRGVWASAVAIEKIRTDLEAERSTEGYTKRKEADARRRNQAQAEYVEDFYGAVLTFLAFHPAHANLAIVLLMPLPIMQRRLAAAQWPGRNGFLSKKEPKPLPSLGNGAKRPLMTRWSSQESKQSDGKCDECSLNGQRNC
jgi:hypothetical protein